MRTRKEYFKEFDHTDSIKNDYVTVTLSPKGKPRRFDLSYLLDTLLDHYAQQGIPYAYVLCTSNSATGSSYKYGCNLTKLQYALTDDHFLKAELYQKPGKKKVKFDHTKLYEADKRSLVKLQTVDGDIETVTVSVFVLMITRHMHIYDIPFAYAACLVNNEKMSQFFGTCMFYGVEYQLKEDWFRKLYLIELGVKDEPQYITITSTNDDDEFDDFDDEG